MNKNGANKAGKIFGGLAIFAILLAGIYYAGYRYFDKHFYPNTFIGGADFSFAKRNSPKEDLEKRSVNTMNLVDAKGKSQKISVKDINFQRIYDTKELDDNTKLWFLEIFNKSDRNIGIETSYDKDLLEKFAKNSVFIKDKKAPQDAKVVIEDKEVKIIKEVDDNRINKEYLKKAIIEAFEKNNQGEIKLDKYDKPKLTSQSKEILAKKDDLEKFLNSKIVVKAHDKDYTVNTKDIYDEKNNQYSYDILRKKVDEIADSSDTMYKDRKFKTYDGHDITIPAGTYGFEIDREATTDLLYQAFSKKKYDDLEPTYLNVGYQGKDIGDSYIEVDLSQQRMYLTIDGKMIKESPLVSGTVPGAHTLTGVHSLKGKLADTYLQSYHRITNLKYKSFVKYWMPIDYSGIGLHDSSWHNGDYSPTKYLNGLGSNGCVNLPEDMAEYIFNNIEIGFPVLIYETTTHNSTPYY